MKKIMMLATLLLSLYAFAENPFINYHVYGGPGIAVSGSSTIDQLPDSAQSFIKRDYSGESIASCKRNYVKDTSEVKLIDGTEITFNAQGQVTNIKAGDNKSLSPEVLVDILPETTVEHLLKAGYSPYVREIRNVQDSKHRIFMLNTPMPEMIFDLEGTFVQTWG